MLCTRPRVITVFNNKLYNTYEEFQLAYKRQGVEIPKRERQRRRQNASNKILLWLHHYNELLCTASLLRVHDLKKSA